MAKKFALAFLAFFAVFFYSSHVAQATTAATPSITISEVMYDLPGSDSSNGKSREWIEVYNSGNDVSVDAGKWRLYDGGGNRTLNGGAGFSIPAGSYVVLAGDKDTFMSDNPNFSGTVYDTGMTSLNNTGATIKILDQDGNIVDSVTYASSQGGAGDGNSLQKINGSWTAAMPTAGLANEAGETSSSDGGDDDALDETGTGNVSAKDNSSSSTAYSGSGSSSSSVKKTKTKPASPQKIKAQLKGNKLAYAGIPFHLEGKALGPDGAQLFTGRFFWSFGDGDSRQVNVLHTDKFEHTYYYPGTYTVTLEYYPDLFPDTEPVATDTVTIKVVAPEVSISSVGDKNDFFIELSNDTDVAVDLSNWSLLSLASDHMNFIIPHATMMAAHSTLMLSPKITHFTIADKNLLKLLTPVKEAVSAYRGK